jgi:hypothetical protein
MDLLFQITAGCLIFVVAAGGVFICWDAIRAVVEMDRKGCCPGCDGTGVSGDETVPGGLCWDCKATGHPHAGRCRQ